MTTPAGQLGIDFTYDCNYRCPWCNEIEHLGMMSGPIPPSSFEALINHIKERPYESYSFQGGEPLLYPNQLFEAMDIIRDIQPSARLEMYSNGTQLTKAISEQLNLRNVGVYLSIEASGYKGINNLVKHATEPYRVLGNIRMLNTKYFRIVVTREKLQKQNLAAELLLMHNIFPGCLVATTLDYTDLPSYDLQDIGLYERQVSLLQDKASDLNEWYVPMQGFTKKCWIDKGRFILATGKIRVGCKYNQHKQGGCGTLRTQMRPEVYKRYVKAVSFFEE